MITDTTLTTSSAAKGSSNAYAIVAKALSEAEVMNDKIQGSGAKQLDLQSKALSAISEGIKGTSTDSSKLSLGAKLTILVVAVVVAVVVVTAIALVAPYALAALAVVGELAADALGGFIAELGLDAAVSAMGGVAEAGGEAALEGGEMALEGGSEAAEAGGEAGSAAAEAGEEVAADAVEEGGSSASQQAMEEAVDQNAETVEATLENAEEIMSGNGEASFSDPDSTGGSDKSNWQKVKGIVKEYGGKVAKAVGAGSMAGGVVGMGLVSWSSAETSKLSNEFAKSMDDYTTSEQIVGNNMSLIEQQLEQDPQNAVQTLGNIFSTIVQDESKMVASAA